MRSLRLVLSLVLLAALPAAPAATSEWTALGPFGGSVDSLTADPADARVLYLTAGYLGAAGYQGAFKSADGGASWFPIRATASGPVAVAPGRAGTVWLPDIHLLKSADGGGHWTAVAPDTLFGVRLVAVDPTRPSRVYAWKGTSEVWASQDGGASWRPSSPFSIGYRGVVLVASPAAAGTVFAGTEEGLFRSVDGARTFRRAGRGLPAGEILALAIAPSNPWTLYASVHNAGVFRSGDGGASWQAVARQPIAAGQDRVLSLAVSPRSPRTVWAGTEAHGLWRSVDGGRHWAATGPSGRPVPALAVPSPGAVYAAVTPTGQDLGGVFASRDGGASWTRRVRGLGGLEVTAMAADPGNRDLWAGLQQALFRGGNGGRRWTRISREAPDLHSLGVIGVAVDPTAPSTVYVSANDGLWRTADRGSTWTALAAPGTLIPGRLWVDPAAPSRLWGLGTRLLLSVDGGLTWSAPAASPLACSVQAFAFAPSDPATLYAAGTASAAQSCRFETPAVYRSADGGATWIRADGGFHAALPAALAVDPVDPRLVYLAAVNYGEGDGLWKSTDGGGSWTPMGHEVTPEKMSAVAASPVAGVVWAGSEDGRVFRSGDGGVSWTDWTGNLITRQVHELLLDPANPRRLYARTPNGVWVLEDED